MPAKRTVIRFPSPDSPFTIAKYKYRRWSVSRGDELIVVTAYKKGAQEVVRLLEELEDFRRKFGALRLIEDLVELRTATPRR